MNHPVLFLPLIGFGLMFLQMTILWVIQLRIRNAAVVDVGWAAGLGWLAILYAFWGDAPLSRKWLLGLLTAIWATRLAWHLYRDRVAHGTPEEGRYVTLRQSWGEKAPRNFFLFFQAQAVLNIVLSIPFLLIALNSNPRFSWLEYAGALLWIIAVKGEALADRQLKEFKTDKNKVERVCRRGLWKYSRHPNYFFEWLIWCSYALIALSAPFGWMGVIGPVIILFLLLKVSGIPPTEAQALKSRGEEYRHYQKTTSAFIPWFSRKD